MKRNAFGQLGTAPASIYHRPFLRYFAPVDGDGGAGGDGKEFKAPASQEELDRIVNGAVARTHKQYEGHNEMKEKAGKWDAHEAAEAEKSKPKPKSDDKSEGLSEEDVEKRIQERIDAREKEKDLELAIERVTDRLEKALDGRTYSASKLFSLDRKQLVAEDGKSVNEKALTDWVKDNSKELDAVDTRTRRRLPGQGERDSNVSGGSVSAGRDLYDENHKKKSGKD